MDRIEQCYICNGTDIVEGNYEDYDDVLEIDIDRFGYWCKTCKTFHYEENDRIVCIIAHKEETTSSLNGYIPEI